MALFLCYNRIMDKAQLKKWLKIIKTYEETGSTLLGIAVVVLFVFSMTMFVKRSALNGPTVPEDNSEISIPEAIDLPQVDISTDSAHITQPTSSARTHVVKPGEGLWQIAEQYYQDGNRYLEIYQANTDLMKSPEDIRVGMELNIP